MKEAIARYVICTITTKDLNLKHRRDAIKISGVTDEEIFSRGLEAIAQDQMTQNNKC